MKPRASRTSSLVGCLLLGVLALGLVGCGGGKKGTVTGKVTYDGKQVMAGTVTFTPAKGSPITADIGDDGTFSAPNVPTGDAKISVSTGNTKQKLAELRTRLGTLAMKPPPGVQVPKDALKGRPQEAEDEVSTLKAKIKRLESSPTVPESYGKPDTSQLTYTVTSGKQEHDIDLQKRAK